MCHIKIKHLASKERCEETQFHLQKSEQQIRARHLLIPSQAMSQQRATSCPWCHQCDLQQGTVYEHLHYVLVIK